MGTIVFKAYIMQTKVKVQTVPYISTAHCTLAPYASAGVALRSNADESRELYGTFGKRISNFSNTGQRSSKSDE
jgi:hypothetical protein